MKASIIKLLSIVAFSLVGLIGLSAPAVAAPPRDVSYSYTGYTFQSRDGQIRNYYITASVKYNKNGTVASTSCGYAGLKSGTSATIEEYGQYVVPGPTLPADLTGISYEAMREYCVRHFEDRIVR